MNPRLSSFGRKLTQQSGILELMSDLGQAMAERPDMNMLGGGNPSAIPEIQAVWRRRMQEILSDTPSFDRMLGNYDTPRGRPAFMDALADYLNQRYGWGITRRNITITNGSQNAFFYLFNLLAGEGTNIQLPLAPEYIGYADQGIDDGLFKAQPALIDRQGDRRFKYRIDFDGLTIDDRTAGLCVSRPTNPTGNVVTDAEIRQLSELAKANGIPLIIDNAYGAPFPGIIFSEVNPIWEEHIVLSLSLSKLGLPGTRTGILIANEWLTEKMSAVNAVVNLANGNIGQEIVTPLLVSGEMDELGGTIRDYYHGRAEHSAAMLAEALPDDIPWRTHVTEGSMFFWLWLEDCPVDSAELYRRIKERGTIVVPGHYFFFGLEQDWAHSRECLRIHYAMPEETLRAGFACIADVLAEAYNG